MSSPETIHLKPEPLPSTLTAKSPAGRNVHLDAMRGIAAVSVVCTHIRQDYFVPYHQAGSGLLVKALYIDHYVVRAAVIFFFVLSGYLVGMSVVNSISAGRWSWREYLLSRLSRLYVVLVPALLLTAVLDWIGRANPATRWGYLNGTLDGLYATAHFDTWRNFFGSLFFLQGIRTNWYGSNSPLWSLSCEFWYYIVFPVMAISLIRRKRWTLCVLFLAGMGWFLGTLVVALFPCWLAGVVIGLIAHRLLLPRRATRQLLGWSAALVLLVVILASGAHKLNGYAADYVISLAAMALIWVALSSPLAWGPYARAAVALSEMSYTLYLTHRPFLLLLQGLWLGANPWPADLRHVGLALVPLLAAVIFAYGMYRLFESHTNEVRRWLRSHLRGAEVV